MLVIVVSIGVVLGVALVDFEAHVVASFVGEVELLVEFVVFADTVEHER